MNTRIFHGELVPNDIARILIARYNHGNLHAQQLGSGSRVVVQIASTAQPISGGQTAITVSLEKVGDGVSIQLGKQSWLGVAASLGETAFWTWRNPWNLLSRLDDLAQDIENLQLIDNIWETIEDYAQAVGASFELSERLKRMVCEYCNTANPVGESRCIACGAPLGGIQPVTCKNCGYLLNKGETICPNCGMAVSGQTTP